MTSYSRQDVLRILQIGSRQLQGWERARLIPQQQTYSFQDLGQLRTLRTLREEAVPAASIRHSIVAMRAVAGMANPLLEATLVRTGSRLVFRHHGSVVDPIRRQLLFDFERFDVANTVAAGPAPRPIRIATGGAHDLQTRFLEAVQAEEAGEKQRAIDLYQALLQDYPEYAAARINLGTIYFHLREFARAEELYRKATEVDPEYVLAFFDLGNVLDEMGRSDESIAAYRQALALSPHYADAHYNLALAHERRGERRDALHHWQAYLKLDSQGPWADHARGQLHKLLKFEKLAIASRSETYILPSRDKALLNVVRK